MFDQSIGHVIAVAAVSGREQNLTGLLRNAVPGALGCHKFTLVEISITLLYRYS